MTLAELKQTLAANSDGIVRFVLPDGELVPAHAHLTEVARADKHFVDCGGTSRADSFCRLQVWVGRDAQHRLNAGKLHHILNLAAPLLPDSAVPVDVEYEVGYITQFPLESIAPVNGELHLRLGLRHTACLAQDKCGEGDSCGTPDLSAISFKPRGAVREVSRCC